MIFADRAVAAVFARYEARAAADAERMRAMGPAALDHVDEFLLPIGPDTGRLLHALILGRRPARILELGTSYGYSTLFLADAAHMVGAEVVSMDLARYKQDHAAAMLAEAGLAARVEFRCGDAVELIAADPGVFDFVLLDIWKQLYSACLDAVLPKLTKGGMIVADNMLRPIEDRAFTDAYRAATAARRDLQCLLLDIGSGIEIAVKRST